MNQKADYQAKKIAEASQDIGKPNVNFYKLLRNHK
jgi:hypothetical protein